MVASFAYVIEFHAYREVTMAAKYNLDEVSQQILNTDSASWIKKVRNKSTCFQLNPFHRNKMVKEKIHHRKAVSDIMGLLSEEKTKELSDYLETYKKSLEEESEIEDVQDLIRYYENNQKGLLPYQSQGLELSGHPKGLVLYPVSF